jgi:hypothetical protein
MFIRLLVLSSLFAAVMGSPSFASEKCSGVQGSEDGRMRISLSFDGKSSEPGNGTITLRDYEGFKLRFRSDFYARTRHSFDVSGTDAKNRATFTGKLAASMRAQRHFTGRVDFEGDYFDIDAVLTCR